MKRQTRFIKTVFGTTRRLRNEPLRTMTSIVKILLLPLGILLLIAVVYHSSNNSGYTDDTERNAVELQLIRRRRTITPIIIQSIHYCKLNQYYDQEEGRCIGVPGGGKALHVERRRSCGLNVLKPHCKSSLYYHICKRDKSILAQCASRQIFDNRLQRCVYYDSSKLTPNIIPPDSYMYYDHVRVPSCTRSGRFPVLGHCSMFYTCDTNGHRFYQSVLKCPQNTGYQVDRGICNVAPDCQNNNSVDTVCVPDAPAENVESPSLDEPAERNLKETPEILEESTASADDPIVEREENMNSKIYDDIIVTTPGSIIDTLLENNYNDNDSNMDVLKSVKEDLVPDGIDEEITHSQVPNLPETVQKASDEGQNEENGTSLGLQITPSSTTELDDAPLSITTSTSSIKPEYRTNADVGSETTDTAPFSPGSYILSKLSEGTQDVTTEQYKNIEDSPMTLSNFNTEAIDPASAINQQEFPPISDVSPNVDEKMQNVPTEQIRNNEDSAVIPPNFNTDLADPDSVPTVSNVPESSLISDVLSNIDEKMQDVPTEQYKNNEDSTVISPSFNTDSVDLYSTPTVSNIPESSLISDVSPNINEKMQDVQYKNNEDSAVTPSNFNTDSVDPYSAPTVSDVPEFPLISEASPNIDEEMQDAPTEQYKNNEDSAVIPSILNTDSVDLHSAPTVSDVPESPLISDVSPNIDEKMQDVPTEQYENNEGSAVIPSNFDTDSVDPYSAPTISDVSESPPISDVSPNIDDKMQDVSTEQYENNEGSVVIPSNFDTDSVDPYSATVSDVPESPPISDVSPNIDEKMQDVHTEQYENNEDSTVIPSNLNTDSVDPYSAPTVSDVPESPLVSDVSPNIDEEMQDVPTEQYKNNEDNASNFNTEMYRKDDGAVTLPNSSTEVVDPNLTSALDDIPPTTDNLKNDDFDVVSSTLTPATLPSQAVADGLTTEESHEAIPSIDSKLADTSVSTPDEVESASTYSPENTDDLYLTPTPRSTLISKEMTAPMDITTTIPSIQNPSISDTDLVTQNGKDSTEASASLTQ